MLTYIIILHRQRLDTYLLAIDYVITYVSVGILCELSLYDIPAIYITYFMTLCVWFLNHQKYRFFNTSFNIIPKNIDFLSVVFFITVFTIELF